MCTGLNNLKRSIQNRKKYRSIGGHIQTFLLAQYCILFILICLYKLNLESVNIPMMPIQVKLIKSNMHKHKWRKLELHCHLLYKTEERKAVENKL